MTVLIITLVAIVLMMVGLIAAWITVRRRLPPPTEKTAITDAVEEFDFLSHEVERSVAQMRKDFDLIGAHMHRKDQ